jgi:RNA polymerase sigma-70 factor (ECF subfamily)
MDEADRAWRERGLREAVLAGDERAWRRWYDESYAGLSAYLSWRCGGLRDHAEELLQEVWLTAVRRLDSFDPSAGSFAGWLRGIAAQLARNHFRRERRRRTQPLTFREVDEAAKEAADARERGEQVARALAALPEHYESALRAKYLDGLDVASIAAERGTSVKAVESLLSRAREAFRAAYQAREHGP